MYLPQRSTYAEDMDSARGGEWACPKCTFHNIGGSTCEMCKHSLSPPTETFPSLGIGDADDSWTSLARDELRIVLLGRTGCGKSATGNCILGKREFKAMAAALGVTAMTKQGSARRFDRTLHVVDTPGLFDPCMTNEKVITEITKCFGMTSPGPHAFIMVVHIGRFTEEEKKTVEEFKKYFGPFMMKYLLVLFTRTDELEGRPLRDYVQIVPEGLKELLRSCGHRYIGFNNKASQDEKEQQVQQLLGMVDDMVRKNGGTCYTSEMYKEAEKVMRRREMDIRNDMEREKRGEIERIEIQHAKMLSEVQEEYHQMMKEMQDKMNELKASQSRGDKRPGLTEEVKTLKDQMAQMKKDKELEDNRQLRENTRKLEELETKYQKLEEDTRNIARKEVEAVGFSLVWQGIKSVAEGLFQELTNIVKKLV